MTAYFRPASFALAAMASLVTLTAATPAFAESETISRSMEVGYDDLNLGTAKGVARLNQRIKSAANSVCRYRMERDIRALAEAQQCRDAAIARSSDDVELAIARQQGEGQLAAARIGVSAN